MATPRQKSKTEVKLGDVEKELKRLQRIERRFRTLLATITLDRNEESMPDRLIEMAEGHSRACEYDFHKDSK